MGHSIVSNDTGVVSEMVVDVAPELDQETLQRRSTAVNAILRFAILGSLQMELDAALGVFADFVSEIVHYDKLLLYFWDEDRGCVALRLARGFEVVDSALYGNGNVLSLWSARYSRPLLLAVGQNEEADRYLGKLDSTSAVVVPIIVSNRNLGSLQLFASAPFSHTPEDAQLLWIFSLVAENQLNRGFANEGLLRYAFTDYLTGLRTRGYFEQQLEAELKRAGRKATPLSLLMVDIDHFKQLNDQFGHHVGDQVLREVGLILQRDMRDVDTVARYGGEEFVLILPETDADGALQVAQRLRHAVGQQRFLDGNPAAMQRLSISIGIAVLGASTMYKQELIRAADAALYEAKARGRDQVVVFSDLIQTNQSS